MPINDLIDTLIEECSGDVHGALKALLLINERLEAERNTSMNNPTPIHRVGARCTKPSLCISGRTPSQRLINEEEMKAIAMMF